MVRGTEVLPRKKVLFLAKYGRRAASTRFRLLQYFPYVEQAGLEPVAHSLLSDAYLAQRLEEGRSSAAEAAKGLFARLLILREVRKFALVVVYMEAMPYLPAFFERALNALGVPYVCDFDDAWFHHYDLHPSPLVRRLLSGKIPRVIAGATLVTAGNEYLADYARRHNPRVVVVPTVVDVDKFAPGPPRIDRGRVVIGWIGSATTAPYVVERQPVWREVIADRRSVLRVVGAGPVTFGDLEVEARPWREETEIAEVRDFDIGIMPLGDDPFSRGKCGFKLIQYLACGVPAVASPVGVNSRIVAHGETGFLCNSDQDWIARLKQLVADDSLRRSMGKKGRESVCRDWSLQRWGPEFARLLAGVANGVG